MIQPIYKEGIQRSTNKSWKKKKQIKKKNQELITEIVGLNSKIVLFQS